MGNSQTKEARGYTSSSGRHANAHDTPVVAQDSNDASSRAPREHHTRRGSRPDFSFLGLGGSSEPDASSLEARRESKAEREARRTEKERQARLKERERSMREEHVDGGYLVTQGVYVGPEDYNKGIVRQLMIERRLAPFWRGLNDFSESWAEHQLMAAARGLPIPPADHVPPELEYTLTKNHPAEAGHTKSSKSLTIPINSRSESFQSDQAPQASPSNGSLPSPLPPGSASSPTAPLFRARAKTLASLASSRQNSSTDIAPREFQLPPDPFVNGQPVEVYLYKDASECPICFLYYPPYLNTTRCCEQPICSECFVQIKRPDPHPPEHEQPDPNAPPVSEEERLAQAEGLLVSEIAACPYCKQPDFGITYTPPMFRRGLTFGTGSQPYQVMSATSSQASLSSGQMSPGPGRRRGQSLSASAPEVITTDKVRPDWLSKLQAARAHAARRSAAATALHTAAYMMGPNERPGFPGFGRRGSRRPTFDLENTTEAQRNALAYLAERHNQSQGQSMLLPPPRGSSSRRSRIDDIEELMMIEAIRLSLASEEERRRKEDKEARKKAKKEEKESRRQEKTARKNSLLSGTPATPGGSSTTMERSLSDASSIAPEESAAKGKSVERGQDDADEEDDHPPTTMSSFPSTSQESLSTGVPIPSAPEPFRRSHLRQMSNASSASSSFAETGMNYSGTGTPPANASAEPMFNFRSLTAMITEDEKASASAHVEHREEETDRPPSLEDLGDSETASSAPERINKQPDVAIESARAQVDGKSGL